jgi:hypothetical protein
MSELFKHNPAPSQAKQSASLSVLAILPAAVRRQISQLKVRRRVCQCCAIAVGLLVGVSIAHADPSATNPKSVAITADPFAGFVAEASQRFAIPSSWIQAVMQAESLGDVRALSPKGAIGLMQIMPETWAELRLRYGLGADPYDPHDNITAGAAYLRELHDRYGERGFLAAYNAGPGRYEDYLTTGRPLPSETLSYMATVAALIGARTDDGVNAAAAMAPTWTSASLFVPHTAPGSVLSRPSSNTQMQQRPADETAQNRTALAPLSDGLFAKRSGRNGRPSP